MLFADYSIYTKSVFSAQIDICSHLSVKIRAYFSFPLGKILVSLLVCFVHFLIRSFSQVTSDLEAFTFKKQKLITIAC